MYGFLVGVWLGPVCVSHQPRDAGRKKNSAPSKYHVVSACTSEPFISFLNGSDLEREKERESVGGGEERFQSESFKSVLDGSDVPSGYIRYIRSALKILSAGRHPKLKKMLRNLSSLPKMKMSRNLSTLGKPVQVPPPPPPQGQSSCWADKPLFLYGMYTCIFGPAFYKLGGSIMGKYYDWKASTLRKWLKDAEAELEQLKKRKGKKV